MAKSVERSSTSSEASPEKRRGSASVVLPDLRVETLLWKRGVRLIAGVDEAGRGAWAGPVVAAAVVLPMDDGLLAALFPPTEEPAEDAVGFVGVRDSKQLTFEQRAAAERIVRAVAVAVGVGIVAPSVVDEIGLSFAGQLAFWRAVDALGQPPEHLLVDGFPLWSPRYRQTALIHGDARCISIAAASVVAKVTRDRMMAELDREAPGYGFARNRGYGTKGHASALRDFGPSVHHRRSYAPVSASLLAELDE